jgi:hypothetical protein
VPKSLILTDLTHQNTLFLSDIQPDERELSIIAEVKHV